MNKVNKRNINRLISLLKRVNKSKDTFKMDVWHDKMSCGTVGCIGGWAEGLVMKDTIKEKKKIPPIIYEGIICEWLGLENSERTNLFYMSGSGMLTSEFDREYRKSERIAIAIMVLDNLKNTGKVEWLKMIDKFGPGTREVQDE